MVTPPALTRVPQVHASVNALHPNLDEVKMPICEMTNDAVILNGERHCLPITKKYILSEFKDVFEGIGKLPGGKYHIELKPDAQPVQGVKGITGCVDDVLARGVDSNDHDVNVLKLLKTARMNGIKFNPKKLQFKSSKCEFFGHTLTPEGMKIDDRKVEDIKLLSSNIKFDRIVKRGRGRSR